MARLEFPVLEPADDVLLQSVPWGSRRLALGVILVWFREEGRPPALAEASQGVTEAVARELAVDPALLDDHDWSGRSHRRLVQAVREHLGVRVPTSDEREAFRGWLVRRAWQVSRRRDLVEQGRAWLRERGLELPSDARLVRWTASAQGIHTAPGSTRGYAAA